MLKFPFNKWISLVVISIVITMLTTGSQLYIAAHQNPQTSGNTFSSIYEFENATFTFELVKLNITRGEDDLIITFGFQFTNETLIPDATINYNITDPLGVIIYQQSILVNTNETFNETIEWFTFNSEPEGFYNVTAIANSTATGLYQALEMFYLNILPVGRIRVSFPINPFYLESNESTLVPFTLTNIGGTNVTDIAFLGQDLFESTNDSLYLFFPSFSNLTIASDDVYENNIIFIADGYFYKRLSLNLEYYTIDEPEEKKLTSSPHIEIIYLPNLVIHNYQIPGNATLDEEYRISFNLTNWEEEVLYIDAYAECDLIEFEDYETIGAIPVSSGYNQFSIFGTPHTEGTDAIWFWIEIEWRYGETVIHSTPILYTVISFVNVVNLTVITTIETQIVTTNDTIGFFDPVVTYATILTSLLLGIGYFSRDVIRGIATKTKFRKQEHSFAEITYPYDTVILDGSNIAWEEKNADNKPKLNNIETMINKLSRANFKKIITVADAALRYQIDDQKKLDRLVKEGAIKMLPARVDGDKFILRLAEEENGMIISNDMFKEFREQAPWIDERRIPYTILTGEVWLHPTSVSPTPKEENGETLAFDS
ncbi:MAG: hypothetical protein KAS95_05635 [Candidatus Heimdallarchaeota archaeon]|nr:hypothetical protein [Candidatus Heimdallarchaeota archaeon]